MRVSFGKLTGSVGDGEKNMEIMVNGKVVGLISVFYRMRHIGATRRKEHIPTDVEGYVEGLGEYTFEAMQTIDEHTSLADAIAYVKAQIRMYAAMLAE